MSVPSYQVFSANKCLFDQLDSVTMCFVLGFVHLRYCLRRGMQVLSLLWFGATVCGMVWRYCLWYGLEVSFVVWFGGTVCGMVWRYHLWYGLEPLFVVWLGGTVYGMTCSHFL